MKCIFKIIEYVPDTQIIVNFCKITDNKLIDEYSPIAIDLDKLDTYNCGFFINSLARVGTNIIESQEKCKPIINESEIIESNQELNIESLVGRNIEFNLENYRQSILKMRRVEL
jgi:hypothetical protein